MLGFLKYLSYAATAHIDKKELLDISIKEVQNPSGKTFYEVWIETTDWVQVDDAFRTNVYRGIHSDNEGFPLLKRASAERFASREEAERIVEYIKKNANNYCW